jgi:hypothetical protein
LFWFRLAKELGMSVRRAQEEIASDEFTEWIAYYELEPFGELRADVRQAHTSAILASVHRRKGSRQPRIADFIFEGKPAAKQSIDDMHNIFRQFVSAHNKAIQSRQRRAGGVTHG